MDSDDDGFAKQDGEALDIGGDFDDSSSEQEAPIPAQNKPSREGIGEWVGKDSHRREPFDSLPKNCEKVMERYKADRDWYLTMIATIEPAHEIFSQSYSRV